MNTYDLTVIFDGKLTPAKRKSASEKLGKLITTFNGKVGDIVDWGEKALAYPIKKHDVGYFMTFPVELISEDAKKLNGKLRLEDSILRYLLIKTDKLREAKKTEKTKKKAVDSK